MEWIALVLASVMGLISPTGTVLDQAVETAIRNQLDGAEFLDVRIDNTPTHQVLNGQLDRLQLAGQGLWLLPDVRVAQVEMETDAIDLDLDHLREGTVQFDAPLQAGIHLVLTEADLNRALQSPWVIEQLHALSRQWFGEGLDGYDFVHPQVEFLGDNRLQFHVSLAERSQVADPLAIAVAVTVQPLSGRRFHLEQVDMTLDGTALPEQLVTPVVQGLNQQLDLGRLEESGVLLRVLDWSVNSDEMAIVALVRLEAD